MPILSINLRKGISEQKANYVSTVELNEAAIKKDIQEQEKHNIAMDRLSLKEGEYLSRDSGK